MAIYYLDVDDEITSAAARIRDSSDGRIALVLSSGSRVATSRINFRLLAREARHRHKRLAIIAADPSVQSVARSAELPVYASVGEYERSEAALVGARATDGQPGGVGDALDELSLTVGPAGGGGPASKRTEPAATGSTRVAGLPPASGSGLPHLSIPVAVMAAIGLVAVLVVGAAGFFFYPSASVVLTLSQQQIGPMTVSVKVDPAASAANFQTGTVPGLTKAFPVQTSGTFQATGQDVVDTAAAGAVTFSTISTLSPVTVIVGTKVTTASGIAFTTTSTVTVPKATVSGNTISRGTVDAPVQAVAKGTSGNVAAGTITRVSPDLAAFAVTVTNKAATSGGTHTVTPQIQQSDIDAAEATLSGRLDAAFHASVTAADAAPAGSSLFAETAQLGVAICNPDPATLVGQDAPSFDISCKGTGTATMAQMATMTDLAEQRLRAAVRTGYSLVENSIGTNIGKANVDGSSVVVPVAIQGSQVPVVDANKLRSSVEGKSLDDARALLSQYGTVDISVSPDWASTLPSFDFRIDFQIVVPSAPGKASSVPSSPGGSQTATVVVSTPAPRTTDVVPSPAPPSPANQPSPEATPLPTESPSPSVSPSPGGSGAASAPPSPSPTSS